jgi:hypothetical protein
VGYLENFQVLEGKHQIGLKLRQPNPTDDLAELKIINFQTLVTAEQGRTKKVNSLIKRMSVISFSRGFSQGFESKHGTFI